jgi:hypothetical protein
VMPNSRKKEKKRKEKRSSLRVPNHDPRSELRGARHPCRCVFGSREVAVIQRGRACLSLPLASIFVSDASLFLPVLTV